MSEKEQFIKEKMPTLVKEGYSRPQAYAISLSYWNKKQQGGEQMYAQQGTWNSPFMQENPFEERYTAPPYVNTVNRGTTVPLPPKTSTYYPTSPISITPNSWSVLEGSQGAYNSSTGQYEESAWNLPSAGNTPMLPQTPTTEPRQAVSPVNEGMEYKGVTTPTLQGMADKNLEGFQDYVTTNYPTEPTNNSNNQYEPNRVNILNPYGGLSMDYALNYAGRGFGAKNPWQAGIGTGLSLLKGARNFLTGYGEGKENLRVAEEMQDYQFDRPRNYVYGQSGGKVKNSDIIAQNAIVDEGMGNVNVEGDEVILRNNGQVQPVVGEPHTKNGKIADGVNVTLNDGDKVISDYVKLKPTDIKDLKERYNVALKKGVTFAQAQKKIDQKLGIKKLEDEKATVLEKLEKAGNIEDKDTKELSENALLKSYASINEKLGTLQGIRAEAADFIFERQERQPKKGDGTQLFDKNGKEVSQEGKEVYQQGGDFYITQLAKKHNIPLERAMELVKMQGGGEMPPQEQMAQEQGGNEVPQEQQIMQMVAEALQSGAAPEEILQQLVESGVPQEEATMIIQGVMQQMQAPPQEQQPPMAQQGVEYTEEEQASRLDDFFRNIRGLGYEGEKQIGKMQDWVAENYPEQVNSYFSESGQPLTAKHVDLLKQTYPWAFKHSGISPDKDSASYTKEEKQKLFSQIKGKGDGSGDDGLTTGEMNTFLLSGFKDNKWDWRFPMVKGKEQTAIDPTQKGIQAGLIPQPPTTDIPVEDQPLPTPTGTTTPQPRSGVKNIMPNFEPYIPLFGSIQPIAKQTVDLDRLEPIKATAEPMLAEQERMRATDVERVEQLGLTPQQQEALMASGLATSQGASNDAISKVEQWNAQNQFATDQYNAGASGKEQIMNNQYSADYQDKMMQTLANLEESTRNQYRTQFLQGQSDRNYVTNLNKINTLSDAFAITPSGVEYLNNTAMPVEDTSWMNKKIEEMTPEERENYKKMANFAAAKKRNG